MGPWGWLLRRDGTGFALDVDDRVWRLFSAADEKGKRYRLLAVEDQNRNRITLRYEKDRLVQVIDSAGRVIRVGATPEGRIASIEVKNAIAQEQWIAFATYTYDGRGNLVVARDADGFSARYEYDEEHRLTADTDRTGLTFHFVYDREGRCAESWGDYPGKRDPSLAEDLPARLADGVTRVKGIHHCRFDYMPDGYSEVTDSTQVRRFFGTRHGTLTKSVEGLTVTTSAYRDDGHLVCQIDALGCPTLYELRDLRGRILKIVDPLDRVILVKRDANGLPVQVIDPAGGVTTFERDPCGNLLFTGEPAGGVTAFRCDVRGLITEQVDPKGGRTTYEHDAQGNVVAITDPSGAVRHFSYDPLGRRVSETDPLGVEQHFTYSPRGDLVAILDGAGGVTRYTYDGERGLTRTVDPEGRTTELTWGGYHKLCAVRDPNGYERRFIYNFEGELTEIRNECNEQHRLEYDTNGHLVRETTFDGRVLAYRNDVLGRPIQITTGNRRTTQLTYDLAGQLVMRVFPHGSVEEFEYTPRGEISVARGPAGECRFERDAAGRIVREVQIVGGEEHSVTSVYDPEGRCVERATSLGHVEAIQRDALGMRVRTVLGRSHVVEHENDPLGRELARKFAGGGRIESAYDAAGWLARRRVVGTSPRRSVGAGEPQWIGTRADSVTAETAYRHGWSGELTNTLDLRRGSTAINMIQLGS